MPAMGDPFDLHYDLTPSERAILALVTRGARDAEIAAELEMTEAAVHSCLRRFRERTGLAGRLVTAWAVKHEPCCIAKSA